MKKQIWKKVIGFQKNYQVSNLGRVRSLDHYQQFRKVYPTGTVAVVKRFFRGKLLKPTKDGSGYFHVRLALNGKFTLFKLHRLVAKHFLNDYSDDLTVDHKNENKADNGVDNLSMMTHRQNMKKYHSKKVKNPVYMSSRGQIFSYFHVYCRKHDLHFNRYKFNKCVQNQETYLDTDLRFKRIK